MKIGALQAPQHRLRRRQPRQDAGEEHRRRAILALAAGAFDLMQSGQRQAAPRQSPVDFGQAERQYRSGLAEAFRRSKIAAQIDEPRLADLIGSLSHVLYLFFLYQWSQVPLPRVGCPVPTLRLE